MNVQVSAELQKETPRLEPIENPSNLKVKLAYWLAKQQMGKVITPLKVLYARFPESLSLGKALVDMEDKFTVGRKLQFLIQTYIATKNGCAFCMDMAQANLQDEDTGSEKLNELFKFEESIHFTKKEKAALAYADEVTSHKEVSDETFKRLKKYFSDREIVQITMINAIENFYNLINAPMNIGSDEFCQLWEQSS